MAVLSNIHEWKCLICLLTLLWTHTKYLVLAVQVSEKSLIGIQ